MCLRSNLLNQHVFMFQTTAHGCALMHVGCPQREVAVRLLSVNFCEQVVFVTACRTFAGSEVEKIRVRYTSMVE